MVPTMEVVAVAVNEINDLLLQIFPHPAVYFEKDSLLIHFPEN